MELPKTVFLGLEFGEIGSVTAGLEFSVKIFMLERDLVRKETKIPSTILQNIHTGNLPIRFQQKRVTCDGRSRGESLTS